MIGTEQCKFLLLRKQAYVNSVQSHKVKHDAYHYTLVVTCSLAFNDTLNSSTSNISTKFQLLQVLPLFKFLEPVLTNKLRLCLKLSKRAFALMRSNSVPLRLNSASCIDNAYVQSHDCWNP